MFPAFTFKQGMYNQYIALCFVNVLEGFIVPLIFLMNIKR